MLRHQWCVLDSLGLAPYLKGFMLALSQQQRGAGMKKGAQRKLRRRRCVGEE